MKDKRRAASAPPGPSARNLRLTVKDFGPIATGEVELRPLTVFAGPSNTGKSWLAILIYVLEQHLNGNSLGVFSFTLRRQFDRHDRKSLSFPENPDAWLNGIRNNDAMPLTNGDKKVLASALEGRQAELEEELLRCFGLLELGHLVREHCSHAASVTVLDEKANRSPATCYQFKITQKDKLSLRVDIADNWRLPFDTRSKARHWFLEEPEDYIQNKCTQSEGRLPLLQGSLFDSLFDTPYNGNAFYLPADRGGVMHAHHVVVSALIQSASRAALGRHSSLPALSGVLTDFLQNLLEVADGQRWRYMRRPHRREIKPDEGRADRLEQNVLRGRIGVQKSDFDFPRFTYRPDGWDRPLSLVGVSSMISELAPVALYLRHHVRDGDILILEEPEAHLHPAMQVEFIREIAEWIRQGIRVILTTHSEWVLEELANVVAAGVTDGKKGFHMRMWGFGCST